MKGCFLIGCGPSLKQINVSLLAEHDTITFNRSFLAWNDWGFHPTYYASFDPLALEDNRDELQSLIPSSSTRRFFLNDRARPHWNDSPKISWVRVKHGETFRPSLGEATDFGNIGASCLQLLAAMGYSRVVLLGIDARYSPEIEGTREGGFLRVSRDPDHFIPHYAEGKRRALEPDFHKILGRWPVVAEACRLHSIEVRNASPQSALTCFKRMDFDEARHWITTSPVTH